MCRNAETERSSASAGGGNPGVSIGKTSAAGAQNLAVGLGSVWTVQPRTTLRIDPSTGRVTARIATPRGCDEIAAGAGALFLGCRDSRLIPTSANGMPAFGQYKPDPVNGGWAPWSLQVLELAPDGTAIEGITFFLDTERFFPMFGLPPQLQR